MFLRRKSPLKCLFGLQNLDSDWLKHQNRLVKLGSILTSFDKFWSVYLMFCLFYHFFSLFLTLSDWFHRFPWFRRFSDRYVEITLDFDETRLNLKEEEDGHGKWWISWVFRQFSMVFDLRRPGKWINHRFYIVFKGSWTTN